MQIATRRYHMLLISNGSLYSCGSSSCGVLGHGSKITQCVTFTRINFPPSIYVEQVFAVQSYVGLDLYYNCYLFDLLYTLFMSA